MRVIAGGHMPVEQPPEPAGKEPLAQVFTRGMRRTLGVLAASLLVAGLVAVFGTDNDGGSAALVTLGAASGIAALLGDRIRSFKFGPVHIEIDRAKALYELADAAESAGDHEQAEELRTDAREVVARIGELGGRYDDIRRHPPGWERTRDQDAFVHGVAARAALGEAKVELVREIFPRPGLGHRAFLLGMMEGDASFRDFETVYDAVRHSRSGDEQYHALHVIEAMVRDGSLDAGQARRVKKLLTDLPDNAAYIDGTENRSQVRDRILNALRDDRT